MTEEELPPGIHDVEVVDVVEEEGPGETNVLAVTLQPVQPTDEWSPGPRPPLPGFVYGFLLLLSMPWRFVKWWTNRQKKAEQYDR